MGHAEHLPAGEPGGPPAPTATMQATDAAAIPGSSLPAYRTRIIGRDADRAALQNLLIDRSQRLVVITGPGGIGKTRLAVEVATGLAPYFRHGTRFLTLAPVASGVDLDATVARLLGVPDVEQRSYRDAIADLLATRETLLVVDNAEHVPEIADLLTFIHGQCPAVAILVTSRRTLDIYGELVHEILPLTHRDAGTLPLAASGNPRRSDAIELLRERVRAIDAEFEVTAANAASLAGICDHLGGLPLAIELTAPRLARRDPAALLAEMDAASFPLDASPAAAMQATIRLSYDRLDPDDQAVFRTLCIMCGRWMVEDVLPLLPPAIDELTAIDHLDTLVRRSMLASAASEGEVRFSVNPVLRQFGRAILDELGEASALAGRHADHMIRIVEDAEAQLTGPEQRWWLGRLASLHDDLRDAHHHLLRHDRPVDALRLATALWRYGYTRGHYREIRRMIQTSLERVHDHPGLRSRALNGIGLLSIMLRDTATAREAHRQALAIATSRGIDREIAIARIGLADIAATTDQDTDAALAHLRHAASAYEQLDDARGIASMLTNRGNIEWQLGQLDGAFATHEEARVLYAQASDMRGIAWSNTNTGRIAAQQGRPREAVPRLLTGLDLYVGVGDVAGIAEVLEALAAVAAGASDLEQASTLLGAAATIRGGIGSAPTGLDREQRDVTLDIARRGPGHDAAHARGAALNTEDAVALARAFPVPEPPQAPDLAELRRLAHARFGITKREHEVLALLGQGLTDQQLADRLTLSVRTVHTHMAALMRKLEVSSRVAAVRAAHQAGILR